MTEELSHTHSSKVPPADGSQQPKQLALPEQQNIESPPLVTDTATNPIARNRALLRLRKAIRRAGKVVVKKAIKYGFYSVPLWALLAVIIWSELHTSRWQARYLTQIATEATFQVEPGKSPATWFPHFGPYDERLGYTRIPNIVEHLQKGGFEITSQARLSTRMRSLAAQGVYLPYPEKSRTGLTILDRNNTTIYSTYRPERIYGSFETIPALVTKSILFIENREILDPNNPNKNPAVEWDRLGKAVVEKLKQIVDPNLNAPGGSTIATQLEKYRHSPEGRTRNVRDKLLQMYSASIRAYMYGHETIKTRKLIVLQYINSIPLAALRGYGEVNGLGDGLWAWYGADWEEANEDLRALEHARSPHDYRRGAESYKQILSLFIAHRRPSFYLIDGLQELNTLTDSHLDLLANEGIIPEALRDACKAIKLKLRRSAPKTTPISFVQRKAANAIRTRLLQLTKYPQLYGLDQADIVVHSTMDNEANEGVTNILRSIKSQESVKRLGLSGARNLDRGDPSKVIYSLTLYERVGNANVLRVQTDNFDNPFSINEGTRLDLGSTAKLRTLTTYLDVVGESYDKYRALSRDDLRKERAKDLDPISAFVANELLEQESLPLADLLTKALERRYSASPSERFFTGGGVHTFENFKREDNGKNPTLAEALTHSINLPFVRLMRDISRHYVYRMGIKLESGTKERANPVRIHFLRKFADQEGSYFLRMFYKKYLKLKPHELLPELVKASRASPKHATVMYRFVRPNASVEGMAAFLRDTLPTTNISLGLSDKWFKEYAPGRFNLNDQGYLARVHPLELWLVRHLQNNPGATISEVLSASKDERQQVYEWLFKTPHVKAQDIRIRTLVEMEAFVEIHKQWKKVGYPFNSMVPSLASSIGSSGDRPLALAELVGIILNDGVRFPLVRLDRLKLASNTPYETNLHRVEQESGERVLKPEVAFALKKAMRNVVESGTARRVYNTYTRSDGKSYVIGGKTGTGDHRHETYGPRGQLISSRVVNRTATFAFYVGDRYFGVISAHVPGAEAAKFDFTSALAAELLKILSSSLLPMIERSQTGLSPFPNEEELRKERKESAQSVEHLSPENPEDPREATRINDTKRTPSDVALGQNKRQKNSPSIVLAPPT
jgi:membrane peptidoglycan carboxypeptidase